MTGRITGDPGGAGLQRRRPRRRWPARARAAAGVLALLVAGVLAGCGAGSGPQTPRHTSAPKVASTPSGQPAAGTKLLTLMPGSSQLPRGWSDNGAANQPSSSGPALLQPGTAKTASLPIVPCGQEGQVDPMMFAEGYQVSYAVQPVSISTGNSDGRIVLAGYQPGSASRQFRLIQSFVQRCGPVLAHFHDEITNAPVTMAMAMHTVSGIGDQAAAVTFRQTNGPLPDHTYYPGDYLLVVRAGDYLVEVDAYYVPTFDPAATVRSLASMLVSRVRSLG